MKRLICLLAVVILVSAPVWAQEHNAMLVGWDGAHRDHVKRLLDEGRLPNLKALINGGALVDIEVTSGATDTKAGWSQILTGYKPEVTGVYSNGRFRDVPEGYSVFERLKAQYGKDAIACVAVIGKKGHCGEIDPPFKRPFTQAQDKLEEDRKNRKAPIQPGATERRYRVVEENGQRFVVFNGSPYFTMHKSCDEWHFGLMKDTAVGDKALAMLDQYGKKPFFFFVHFAEVDHSGHKHGEPSKPYDDAIISGDNQLGRMMAKLRELGVYDKTYIYVVADHGFDVGAKHHKKAPHVFCGTNDKAVTRNGCRADITPTVLAEMGVDLRKITPPLDGESLTKPDAKPGNTTDGAAKPRGKRKAK
jgi:predicted AlkP superfamily pyrophosphatase or phosphodiesterase